MNIALWIVAGVFAAGFIVGGIIKLAWSYERYTAATGWPEDFAPGNVKFMGILEILGGLGLFLPGLVGIAPVLVPVAASGMALYTAGAATERIRRAEHRLLLGDLLFLAGMLFVAWGRFAISPLG
ncbi:DoxX family protein [Brevibacterium atlanticum]|uniref:DoxX family protein n=1 Tax=Brevibacterium atlanticum TaxID=2697563 RepID=UPI00141F6998|nr:DoxX family protein [Brevibacterium atlanticum]